MLKEEQGELSAFIRDFLITKNRKIPNKSEVYDEFKNFCRSNYTRDKQSLEGLLRELLKYAKYYEKILRKKEEDKDIRQCLSDLDRLDVKVIYPFLLKLYDDYDVQKLNKLDFIYILGLMESYIVRRLFCGAPTNSLAKVILSLMKDVNENEYAKSVEKILVSKKGTQRMPNDDEFKKAFITKDVYNMSPKNRKHILHRLENYQTKSILNIDEFTIEHIMPQSISSSDKWLEALGDDWKEVHNTYLHTIGNLTLVGSNPELSNKFFTEKRDMKGGFRDCPARLNKKLRDLDTWNKTEIIKRSEDLFNQANEIWLYPYNVETHYEYKEMIGLEDDWTAIKPVAFEFLGEKVNIRDFTHLYRRIIILIYELDPERFVDIINEEDFLNKKFCSYNQDDFNSKVPLSNSGIFLNTGLSSEQKRKNLLSLFEKMNLNEDELTIYLSWS